VHQTSKKKLLVTEITSAGEIILEGLCNQCKYKSFSLGSLGRNLVLIAHSILFIKILK